MTEGSAKVRLVRCPKCGKLLHELPDYSLYQCGGCGAVLRAKKKVTVDGGILERSGMEWDEEDFEKLESLSEKESVSLGNASETEKESEGIINNRIKARIFEERNVNSVNSRLSKAENKNTSADNSNVYVKEQHVGYHSGAEKERPMKPLNDNWIRRDDYGMEMNRSESVSSSRLKGIREISEKKKSSADFIRPTRVMNPWDSDREGLGGGNRRMSVKRSTFPISAYPDEGPSNYHLGSSSYRSDQPVKKYDIPDKIAYLEQDRAELLMRLDELQEQLSRPGTMGEKQRERIPMYSEIAPPGSYHRQDTYNRSMLHLTPDKHVANPYYGHGPAPYMNSHDMDTQKFDSPSRHSPYVMPAYEDLFQQQTSRMHQPPRQYLRRPPHDHLAGRYVDFSHKPLMLDSLGRSHHRPACSCLRCYNNSRHIPSQASPTTFNNKKFPRASSDSHFNQHINAVTRRPLLYHPQANPPALSPQDPQSHVRWPSDVESDMDGFPLSRPKRVVIPRGNKQLCRTIAGGAPFISCCNCFELLKLPRKLKVREKNQQKLRCGACSAFILLEIENKRLITSVPAENKQMLAEAGISSHEVSKEVLLNSDGCLNAGGTTCSADFEDHGYNFKSADFKDALSEERKLDTSKCEERQSLASSPSISSQEEESVGSMAVERDFSYAAELPIKDEVPSTFQISPFQEHPGDVLSSHAENKCEQGNRGGWTEQENVILEKNISQQSSVNVSMETEVEVSFNEYLNTNVSQDSVEVRNEEHQLKINKGSEPFFVGLIKKSFRDFSRSSQHLPNEEHDVLINGKPIPDYMVKRAEKLAGPIQPGDYWYDVRAGFWGKTGEPCLGIIPPFIEEFNYPMPANCSAGNTSVFINGRELHQRDLDLLSSRGLPTEREKSYILEISGRVFEVDTGKELDSLGRLAPTVEKARRGFGMKVPRNLRN
ncbi:EXTRA-LARGE G-PROTEIN-LIKE [Salix koriyanagi]|uniref:EXTRA-LARGE G-PROTEIN-LIKE n=2 Tax=Salix koriyanagi TaxID=2511006 RepID=A0A9Q0SZZ0_9ROSI|nr:EXTRA-LARGE G-PROTEIN-LIKE [Salix koriyanagi]